MLMSVNPKLIFFKKVSETEILIHSKAVSFASGSVVPEVQRTLVREDRPRTS